MEIVMPRKLILALLWFSLSMLPSLLRAQEPVKAEAAPLEDPFEFKFRNGATLKFYGRFEMLTYYDTTSVAVSDWFAYVYPKGTIQGDEDSFNMSVRGSPFGLNFTKPAFTADLDLKGKLEMDFVGGFATGTHGAYSPLVRLKQAWFSLGGRHNSVLVGQSFGVFGPLFPDVGSWIALGTSGNPWIRLPQIRFTTEYAPVKFEVSLNRPMGANEIRTDSLDDVISDGEQSNLPFTMGRFGYSKKFSAVSLETGLSGVYGREKVRRADTTAGTSVNENLPVWMTVYDLFLGSKYVDFKGEFFTGTNLNTFYAGILQGVNVSATGATTIRTTGGWAQVTLKPCEKIFANLGAGIDNPRNGDLAAGTQRSMNLMAYGNLNYRVGPSLVVTLEPSYMRTGYLNLTTNDNWRGMVKTSLSF
jgi:hypothetical protein